MGTGAAHRLQHAAVASRFGGDHDASPGVGLGGYRSTGKVARGRLGGREIVRVVARVQGRFGSRHLESACRATGPFHFISPSCPNFMMGTFYACRPGTEVKSFFAWLSGIRKGMFLRDCGGLAAYGDDRMLREQCDTNGLGQMELPIAQAMRDADPAIGEASGAGVGSGSVDTPNAWTSARQAGIAARRRPCHIGAGGLTQPRTLQRKTWHRKNRGKLPPRKR
ncbi:hypothetical protein CBM2592_U40006 [Cupriavidus taiwanensis]|nr:hypothetical protein CBM2592_U40006 [Cupriavidus taiwanensis]SOZ01016.1 hypothetical protein CBM2591_U30006 [Cupriavidus taiwanensis]